jgi:hypothetical protein
MPLFYIKSDECTALLTTLALLPNVTSTFVWDSGMHSIHTEGANMHCQGITCTRSFYIGLTSAEGQKL